MKRITCSIMVAQLASFLAVLAAIVALALAGSRTDLSIMTGLVGVLGSFRPWGNSHPPAEEKE